MSATGLDVFDKTLETTHTWLNDIMERIGPDRQVAGKALSTVLHRLRDRLPVDVAAHLGAQLPLLIRGAYYDQYSPDRLPSGCETPQQFRAEIAESLGHSPPVDPDEAIAAVFAALDRHLSPGQVAKVRNALPRSVRMAWDGADALLLTEAGA